MRKLKADYVLIGSGSATMLAASRLAQLEYDVLVVNPKNEFGHQDLLPRHGMGLWNAAYRQSAVDPKKNTTLPNLYDQTADRMKEIFPGTLESSGFEKGECWSILSSTPIHREKTGALEKEFFKVEKRAFSSGHFRLLNNEYVNSAGKKINVSFKDVAQVDGGVQRHYAVNWSAGEIGYHLNQYMNTKYSGRVISGYDIVRKLGKRLELEKDEDDRFVVEAEKAILIFFTGDLIAALKPVHVACNEPWIQAVRKKRRERHFAWFERGNSLGKRHESRLSSGSWVELGSIHYLFNENCAYASWSVRSGPDTLERVVDESLRLQNLPFPDSRFVKSSRTFWIEWEWPYPSWKKTAHDTYWATSFEGDLPSTLELLWNLPI